MQELVIYIQKKAYYMWNDSSYHGIDKFINTIKTNKELYAKLQEDIESIDS